MQEPYMIFPSIANVLDKILCDLVYHVRWASPPLALGVRLLLHRCPPAQYLEYLNYTDPHMIYGWMVGPGAARYMSPL